MRIVKFGDFRVTVLDLRTLYGLRQRRRIDDLRLTGHGAHSQVQAISEPLERKVDAQGFKTDIERSARAPLLEQQCRLRAQRIALEASRLTADGGRSTVEERLVPDLRSRNGLGQWRQAGRHVRASGGIRNVMA